MNHSNYQEGELQWTWNTKYMRYYPFNNVKIMLPSLITVMAEMVDCVDDDDDDVERS